MNLFKRKETVAWKVDTEEVMKKLERQKYILELIDKWEEAVKQLNIPEDYYYINDLGGGDYRLMRVTHWTKSFKNLKTTIENLGEIYDDDLFILENGTPKVREDHRGVGNPQGYKSRQEAIDALDRIIDPEKYRTKYHATPPLREMK